MRKNKYLSLNSVSFTVFLAAVIALGPLSTDMYLPTLPLLGGVFAAPASEVQWTLSVFMFGLASFQLIVGPLTDRFGRKRVLLSGLLVFAVACFASLQSHTIVELTFYRLVQSFGVCVAVVVPRAMVRDLYTREDAARQLSKMGTLMGIAPALGPIIGGYIALFYGWEGIFFFLGCYALCVAVIVAMAVEETLTRSDPDALAPPRILANYNELITSSEFLGYVITAALCFAGFFAFISGSSFVLIDVMGVAPEQFGYYFGVVVFGFMLGTILGPQITQRTGLHRFLQIGTLVCFSGGLLLLLLAVLGFLHPMAIVLPMLVYNVGVGIVMPQCQAGAMHPFPSKAGAATALAGFVILGFSAFIGLTVAELYTAHKCRWWCLSLGWVLPLWCLITLPFIGGVWPKKLSDRP